MSEEGNADFVAAGGVSSAQMTLVQLLAVLRGYLRCMPETFAEARFDISRLLPEARSILLVTPLSAPPCVNAFQMLGAHHLLQTLQTLVTTLVW